MRGGWLTLQAWTKASTALAIMWVLTTSSAFAAPINDYFTNAIAITEFPALVIGDNVDATAEPEEQSFGRKSVWWTWTAPFTRRIAIIHAGGIPSAWVRIGTGGSIGELSIVAQSNLVSFGLPVVFDVTQETTYRIAVDGTSAHEESGPIRFRLVDLAANDNFADALPIEGQQVELIADNTLATPEVNEPDYSWQQRSLWWKWTSPYTGRARFSLTGSSFTARAGVFIGDVLTNLSLVTWTDGTGQASFDAVAGTIYRIQVAGRSIAAAGELRLALFPPHPINDDFVHRRVLGNGTATALGTTTGASVEAGEPTIGDSPGGASVWYAWTAPTNGRLFVVATNVNPLSPGLRLGLLTGDYLTKLKRQAWGWNGASLAVLAGQEIMIGVAGEPADFRVTLNLVAAPPNDHFTNRLVLAGATTTVSGDNTAATLERGERTSRNLAGSTLWYEWTAPEAGWAVVQAQAAGWVPVIGVYRGTSLKQLKRLVKTSPALSSEAFATFNTRKGETYMVSFDGVGPQGRGAVQLKIDLTTFNFIQPVPNAIISAATPPSFSVNTPLPSVDGKIQSVEYLAVLPYGRLQSLGLTTQPPFALVPTNLPAGIIYVVAVGTNELGQARFAPPVRVTVRPSNDDFVHEGLLTGYEWQTFATTAQSTREPGEPRANQGSVWWSWTAPASGPVEVRLTDLRDPDQYDRRRAVALAVFTGSEIRRLKAVPVKKTKESYSLMYRFNTLAGLTYHFAVSAGLSTADVGLSSFELRAWLPTVAPVAVPALEFTEPVDVPLAVSTSESNAVIQRVDFIAQEGYLGPEKVIGSATTPPFASVWSNAPSGYYMVSARVVRWDGAQPLPSPARGVVVHPWNDAFTNRGTITSNITFIAQRAAGASGEMGEPAHHATQLPSVWWSWTAPTAGLLLISGAPVAIYTGDSVSELQLVTDNRFRPISLNAQAGVTYQIAFASLSTVNASFRFYPPRVNDHFTNRLVVSGNHATLKSYGVLASREPGEPGSTAFGTVWWSWTAPASGFVSFRDFVEGTIVAGVYTGDQVDSLQNVALVGFPYSPFNFEVHNGVTYQIALASQWPDAEHIAVDIDFTPALPNDDFADSEILEGTNTVFIASNFGATIEPGEPGQGQRSLWWTWTAPVSGNAYVSTPFPQPTPSERIILEVFKGDALTSMLNVASGNGRPASFRASAGQTYYIRFGTLLAPRTDIPVTLRLVPAPPNDEFSEPTAISQFDAPIAGTMTGSSPGAGDPAAVWPGNPRTVWYVWTAEANGPVVIAIDEASGLSVLGAFVESSPGNLSRVGEWALDDTVRLEAVAGTTYFFAVASYDAEWIDESDARFRIRLLAGDPPANDNFANAQIITGTQAIILATNWTATAEASDPVFDGRNAVRTLWYYWQAPAAGLLMITNIDSSSTPLIGAFLYPAAYPPWWTGAGVGLEISMRRGEEIRFAVDGKWGLGGVIHMGLAFLPAPPNDDFAQAAPVSGRDVTLEAAPRTATGESPDYDRFRYEARDVWWRWTAPASGSVVVTNLRDGARTLFAVYTGDSFTNRQLVASSWVPSDKQMLAFNSVRGMTYFLQGTWALGGDELLLKLMLEPNEIVSASPSAPGGVEGFRFQVFGSPGSRLQVEYSADLKEWHPLRTVILTTDSAWVVDPEPATMRFYRALPE